MRLVLCTLLAACAPGDGPLRAAVGPGPADAPAVRLLTSGDGGATWALRPTALAHDVSSLHACVVDDEVWVSGLLRVDHLSWWEERFPHPFVDVLRSRDLTTWTPARLSIDADVRSVIDPACVVGPQGLELWFAEFYATGVGRAGDPAEQHRPSRIHRTRWTGDHFADDAVVVEGAGLCDPAPVYLDGQLRLFVNMDGQRVGEVRDGRVVPLVEGVTVPHATAHPSGGVLYVQRFLDRVLPVAYPIVPGGVGAPAPLALDPALRACESPSVTEWRGQRLLFCVDVAPRRGP